MRHFAIAVLMLTGCSEDYAPEPAHHHQASDPSANCPGNDCFGMHQLEPPSKCKACGAGGLQTVHHYCKGCATRLKRCAHCGRKSAAKSVEPEETPPPTEPAPPPPPPPPTSKRPDPPKAPAEFNLDDFKGDKLPPVEAKPPGHTKVEHDLIVFACPETQFEKTLERHLSKKDPADPPVPKPSDALVLYVLWGDRLGDPRPEAVFDRKNRRLVVTARWVGRGLMDVGTEYRGYGFRLGPVEAGEYGVWIREATPVDKDGPKLTKTITFKVEP